MKEELEVAEFEQSCMLQRIDDLKKLESRNYELQIIEQKLTETESLIQKLSKLSCINNQFLKDK